MEDIKSFLLGGLVLGGTLAFVFGILYCAENGKNWPLYLVGGALFVFCSWLLGSIIRE